MNALRRNLANAALFQLGWFACVFGAQRPWLLLGAAVCLLLHLLFLASPREWRLIAAVTLLGSALDSLLLNVGLFDFAGGSPVLPLWLALLWALFASTLAHGLAWTTRPWWLGALLGALGGPLSYLAGSRLAGVELPFGTLSTLAILALLWAGVLPACHALADRLGLLR